MATAAANASKKVKEFVFEWEGRDRNGKAVRGEMRAGGEVSSALASKPQAVRQRKPTWTVRSTWFGSVPV